MVYHHLVPSKFVVFMVLITLKKILSSFTFVQIYHSLHMVHVLIFVFFRVVILKLLLLRLAFLNLKMLTILKLKLQAAVISTRLKCRILEQSRISASKIFFRSDSSIVLQYINNENQEFLSDVMCHVLCSWSRPNSEIKDWCFIPGKLNIAAQCTGPIDV